MMIEFLGNRGVRKTKNHDLSLLSTCTLLATLGMCASKADGQCEQAKLTAADAAREDYFGASVDIDGDVAIVGAPGTLSFYFDDAIGAAYVYRKIGSNWVQEQKLVDPVPHPGAGFGWAVAIEGDTALVTAPGDTVTMGGEGAVHVFRYNAGSWSATQKLHATDPISFGYLGVSIALSEGVAAVGQVDIVQSRGALYVFRSNGTSWAQEQELVPTDPQDFAQFGASVSVSGDWIVGGAPIAGPAGAAYVFHWNGSQWIQQQKLIAPDGSASQKFGESLSIYQDLLVIGDPMYDSGFTDSGSAYLFQFSGTSWVQQQKLISPVEVQYGSFGAAVNLQGNRLLIAKRNAAYLYSMNSPGWPHPVELTASDVQTGNGFGSSVALSTQGAIVGAEATDEACPGDPNCNSGSTYLYDLPICSGEIPAVSSWGLVAFCLLVLSAGAHLLRRRVRQ